MQKKSSFFHLILLAKVKLSLAQKHFETIIHAFIASQMDYCDALYYGSVNPNAAARLLTWDGARLSRSGLLSVFRSLHVFALPYLLDLLHSCLRSADQLLQDVLWSKCKLRVRQTFSATGLKLWTDIPPHIRQTPSLSFCFNPAWMRLWIQCFIVSTLLLFYCFCLYWLYVPIYMQHFVPALAVFQFQVKRCSNMIHRISYCYFWS